MSKIVSGIELMQMIADGKIKDGTKVTCEFTQDTYVYSEYNKNLICKNSVIEDITESLTLGELITSAFEILEDKTDEIEEIDLKGYHDYGEILDTYEEKINELVRAVNKLNKPIDTSKDENCMSD